MMEHYLSAITHYITTHPEVGLICTIIIAFAESMPILGTVIPGSVTMTAIGILIGKNALPLGTTFLLAVIGALIGDTLGYWLGKHYQDRIHKVWPFKRYPKMLKLGRAFFKKHGGKSIVIGRFIGPTRSSVPLIAGLLTLSWPRFIIAVIPSAILWAALYLFPGILLGAISLALPKGEATTFTLIGLAIIVLLWLIFWAIQRGFVYLANRVNQMTDRCWDWLSTHHGTRLIPRLLTSKRQPQDHHQLTLLIFSAILLAFFIVVFLSVMWQWGIYDANSPVFHLLQNLRGPRLNIMAAFITELGDKQVITVTSLMMLLYFTIKRQWYAAWHLIIIFILIFSSVWLLKHAFYSPRPQGFMLVNSESSFPSGHVILSTGMVGFLAFIYAQCLQKQWRWIPYTVWSILVILVALSRLILGTHWFCDVIASICLGASLLLLAIVSYRRWLPLLKQPNHLMVAIAISIILPWTYSGINDLDKNIYRSTPYFPDQIITLEHWWNNSTAYTPTYRLSRFGNPMQPFNVQWVGHLDQIKTLLQLAQWEEIPFKENLRRMLARFVSKNPEEHIAFLAQLYHKQPPVLFMIKHIPNKPDIIELRLWRTHIGFQGSTPPLLIGSINYHQPPTSFLDLQPSQQITLHQGGGINELVDTLTPPTLWKKVRLNNPQPLPEKIRALGWDKTILLIRSY